MQRLLDLLKKPGVRYLLVGGSVYVLELAIILLGQHEGMSAVAAVALSYCVGTLVSFLLQKFVTFGDKRTHHKIVGLQLAATALLVVFNLGFTVLVTAIFQNILPTVLIRTLAIATTTIWNFYLYKTRIFKGANEPVM